MGDANMTNQPKSGLLVLKKDNEDMQQFIELYRLKWCITDSKLRWCSKQAKTHL